MSPRNAATDGSCADKNWCKSDTPDQPARNRTVHPPEADFHKDFTHTTLRPVWVHWQNPFIHAFFEGVNRVNRPICNRSPWRRVEDVRIATRPVPEQSDDELRLSHRRQQRTALRYPYSGYRNLTEKTGSTLRTAQGPGFLPDVS